MDNVVLQGKRGARVGAALAVNRMFRPLTEFTQGSHSISAYEAESIRD